MDRAYVSTIEPMTVIDGNVLEGVSATTLWTRHPAQHHAAGVRLVEIDAGAKSCEYESR